MPRYSRPTVDFINQATEILRKRVALAGYRLADLLKLMKNSIENRLPKLETVRLREKSYTSRTKERSRKGIHGKIRNK